MSPREKLAEIIAKELSQTKAWDAPYGVLIKGKGKYQSIIFGKARALDCELRIYNPNFFLLKTSISTNSEKFKGDDALEQLVNRLEEL